jgi:hypothetical protein
MAQNLGYLGAEDGDVHYRPVVTSTGVWRHRRRQAGAAIERTATKGGSAGEGLIRRTQRVCRALKGLQE